MLAAPVCAARDDVAHAHQRVDPLPHARHTHNNNARVMGHCLNVFQAVGRAGDGGGDGDDLP